MRVVFGVSASPFVRKVRVVLAEKSLAYELKPVLPFSAGSEFKRLSPLGLVPAYQEGDVTLSDSSVICAYLERIHPDPALYPADAYENARALWLEEYGDSGLYPVLTLTIFRQRIMMPAVFRKPTDEVAVQKALTEEMPPRFDYLESQLSARGRTLVGDGFSIADVGVATNFVNLRHAGVSIDAERWPKLSAYVADVLARPTFKALIDEEEIWLEAIVNRG